MAPLRFGLRFSPILALLLGAAAPIAIGAPSAPALLPLPEVVIQTPLAIQWTPSVFDRPALDPRYEIRVDDVTALTTESFVLPAQGAQAIAPITTLALADGHAYMVAVRAVQTRCVGPPSMPRCRDEASPYSQQQSTRVQLPAAPMPTPVPPSVTPPSDTPPSATTPPVAAGPSPSTSTTPEPPQSARRPSAKRTITARRRWLAPLLGAHLDLRRSIPLRWRANRRASFYNVQLFRFGQRKAKVLSSWPSRPTLTLKPESLQPGEYWVLVWSAKGSHRAPRYDPVPWVRVGPLRVG